MGNNASAQNGRRPSNASSKSSSAHHEFAQRHGPSFKSSPSVAQTPQFDIPKFDQPASRATAPNYHSGSDNIPPDHAQNPHTQYHINKVDQMTQKLNEINATGRSSKPTTPNIFLDQLVDNDYFSRSRQGSDHTQNNFTNDVFDEDYDDGYGIDEDLTSGATTIDNDGAVKQVLIKFYGAELNLKETDSVFVIGSFNAWRSRVKLEPELDSEGRVRLFQTSISLPLGVYRVKFLVNNQVKYSDSLPIATDKSGNVVNWFEVDNVKQDLVEAGINETYKIHNNKRKSSLSFFNESSTTSLPSRTVMTPQPVERLEYNQEIPDMFQISATTDEILPIDETFLHRHPIPDLPVYLNNSYLNKHFNTHHNNSSDAGVNIPKSSVKGLNSHIIPHVNLKHLLTSNIKNNVLGVACTTRYSGKFLTQIMYSPADYDM